jgi:hypothetical protein
MPSLLNKFIANKGIFDEAIAFWRAAKLSLENPLL